MADDTTQQSPSKSSNPLFDGVKKTLGEELFTKIQESKILVVGAGGIGCELLKNLALSGFQNITTIDLDTIDVSNLNRQFLFRSYHVHQPKCKVAIDAVKHMTPSDTNNYVAHHGNIKEARFGVSFFKGFNVVLNALDNVDARRHVNRVCLAANVPLVEAGTTGYLGQMTVIDKESGTECYECQPKATQKVYPICTIRSTPSLPVHTIVWSKELYKLVFSDHPNNSMLYEDPNASEISTYMDLILIEKPTHKKELKGEKLKLLIQKYAFKFIKALFHDEIQKQIKMDLYKTSLKQPIPLDLSILHTELAYNSESDKFSPIDDEYPKINTMEIWSIKQCIQQIHNCFLRAFLKSAPIYDEFDKDDDLAMCFVTAASNLRSNIFSISPLQSYYSAKGIAGNIIAAIATTNAIIAGLQISQLFHILANQIDKCKLVFCLRNPTRKGYYLQPTSIPRANPNCFICSQAHVELVINCQKWTFEDFIGIILKKNLGFVEPSVYINADLIHEEGEDAMGDAFKANLPKLLKDLPAGGIQHDALVNIEDLHQDLSVDICIIQKDDWEKEEDEERDEISRFLIKGSTGSAKKTKDGKRDEEESDNDDVIVEDDEIEIVSGFQDKENCNKKRSADEMEGNAAKKQKVDA